MKRAFPNLTDDRFNELVVRYLACEYEASEAERLALAYEENAREAESGLTGKSGSLAELRNREVEVATIAGSASREAGEARERRRVALDEAGNAVSALREEGMPEGEWVRHGNAGVYLWSRSSERADHHGVAIRPWEAVERAPSRATPEEVDRMLLLESRTKDIEGSANLFALAFGISAVVAFGGMLGLIALWEPFIRGGGWAEGAWVGMGLVAIAAAFVGLAGLVHLSVAALQLQEARENLARLYPGNPEAQPGGEG